MKRLTVVSLLCILILSMMMIGWAWAQETPPEGETPEEGQTEEVTEVEIEEEEEVEGDLLDEDMAPEAIEKGKIEEEEIDD
mgnify:CR=1 FL=1